jgi:hypothetical protein
MSFGELYRGDRSLDYQFGIVVLNVDKTGKGTGTLAPVCKIKFNKKNELEIENFGQKPFRLANVYLRNKNIVLKLVGPAGRLWDFVAACELNNRP